MSNPQLFLVWRENGPSPRYKHSSFESAKSEASRLALANPGTRFYVLAAVGNAIKNEVNWTLSDERFDDSIPF